MKAILTKVLPATNTKPARLKACTEGGNSIVISWHECEDGRTQGEAHLYAARKLCDKMKWEGRLIGGGTPSGYAFTFAESKIAEKTATYYPLDNKK